MVRQLKEFPKLHQYTIRITQRDDGNFTPITSNEEEKAFNQVEGKEESERYIENIENSLNLFSNYYF